MPLWRPSCRHSSQRRSQPAAAFGQDPTSRHRKRALATWRNQRVRCVVVGVCCTCFLHFGVFAQVHGGGERANAGLRRGCSMGIPNKEGLHLQCVPLARGFMGTLSRPASFIYPSSQCRAPAFTRQDTPRRIADDKSMEENPHQFPQRCPTLALAPMGALLSCAGHPTFNPMGSIQADVRRVRRRVLREVPSGMR